MLCVYVLYYFSVECIRTNTKMYICIYLDFVKQDVQKLYPKLYPYVKITLVEAGPTLLGPFDKALQDYAYILFRKRAIDVRLGTAVQDVEDYNGGKEGTETGSEINTIVNSQSDLYRFPGKRAKLSDGTYLEFGTMVWSAGLAPRTFTEELDETVFRKHPKSKRLFIDPYLRVIGHENTIWAMGDAAVNESGIPLPQLAQVARQQGMYLAKLFSKQVQGNEEHQQKPFSFFSLGSMAFLGELKGIYDGTSAGPLRENTSTSSIQSPTPLLKGFAALLLWRFAYWGRQTSFANKILIPVHWFKTFFFGRDTSRY